MCNGLHVIDNTCANITVVVVVVVYHSFITMSVTVVVFVVVVYCSVVATPGRFLHLVMEMDLKLSSIEYIVFDEADRLFEMGFSDQLREIIKRLPEMR